MCKIAHMYPPSVKLLGANLPNWNHMHGNIDIGRVSKHIHPLRTYPCLLFIHFWTHKIQE